MMKINKHFKLEIIKRFMNEEELEEFQLGYDEAKILSQGRTLLNEAKKNKTKK